MDKTKKSRAVARAAFSRNLNVVTAELANEVPDIEEIQIRFTTLSDRVKDLERMDKQILEAMNDNEVEEEQLLIETEIADEYKIKYLRIKIKVDNILSCRRADSILNLSLGRHDNKESMRTYKLPKIELNKFSGERRDWLKFWCLFKNIHEDQKVATEDKFQYLIQSMEKDTRASKLVNSFPPTAENYDKVIKSLKDRFGREDLLIEVYMREMLKLVFHRMQASNHIPLCNTYDQLETQLRALESLGVTTEMCAAMLYPLVESALPEELLRAWQRNPRAIDSTTPKQRLDELMFFLQAEVLNEEKIAMAVDGFCLNKEHTINSDRNKKKGKVEIKENKEVKGIATAAGLLSIKEKKFLCIFCGQSHESACCEKAKKMTLEERCNVVKEKNACFWCLKQGHSSKFCRSKEKCAWCGKRHVLLMCRNMTTSTSEKDNQKEEPVKKQEQHSLANMSIDFDVFLKTLRVTLINQGKEREVRAVIDTGSHRSYILDCYAEELGFEVIGEQQITHMLFGGSKTKPQVHKGYHIYVQSLNKEHLCNFVALNQSMICQNIPYIRRGPWIRELQQRGIELSDVEAKDEPIALLIGVQTEKREDFTLTLISMMTQEARVTDLWKLDILGITDPIQRKTKDSHLTEVKENFRQLIKINEDNRYEVPLLWKEEHPPLTYNRDIAERRLEATTRKLKSQGLYDSYQAVFDEWLSEGIIEKVPDTEMDRNSYYLPHRHIIKENSTTKIRPVFDASAHGKNGFSLNQCVETGPNLIELIPSILLRFRQRKIGVISDIRKAFLQISISSEDRDVLRFIWWSKTRLEEVEVYRHCRVVFGITSSPFLLGGIIEYHLERQLKLTETPEERNVIRQLLKSYYVDNCVTSVNSELEFLQFRDISTQVMDKGKFELRGWECTGQKDTKKLTSVLGLSWDKEDDTIGLSPSVLEPHTITSVTKRIVLSTAQRIFDPLGVTSPVLLFPKFLLQKLWSLNIGWDVEIPEELQICKMASTAH